MPNAREILERQLLLINQQISKIEEEIEERKRLSESLLNRLKNRLETYLEVKNEPLNMKNHAEDKRQLNKLIENIKNKIAFEEIQCWHDIQKLLWEKRQLEREKMELEMNLKLLTQDKY